MFSEPCMHRGKIPEGWRYIQPLYWKTRGLWLSKLVCLCAAVFFHRSTKTPVAFFNGSKLIFYYLPYSIFPVMVLLFRTDLAQLLILLVVVLSYSESKMTTALMNKIKWRSLIKWTNLWIKTKRRISTKQDTNPEVYMTSVNIFSPILSSN